TTSSADRFVGVGSHVIETRMTNGLFASILPSSTPSQNVGSPPAHPREGHFRPSSRLSFSPPSSIFRRNDPRGDSKRTESAPLTKIGSFTATAGSRTTGVSFSSPLPYPPPYSV